ncbi:MAG: outer membrane protein assembly factor BamA [Arenicellales bacterium]|jgi:outer membrane protein insertion porin family|nr:outer membrane protein assembly factor BamA [Arenicellales bacterium]
MINSPNAISGLKKIAALLLSGWLLSAQALEGFVVSDIRVEGAQNIEVGTIFNYLPVKVGDTIDNDLTNQSIKALFATGFFRDVELRQEGNVLVVIVAERPAIASVEYSGNKDLSDEKIDEALNQTGVTEGQIFNDPLLGRLVQAIEERYFSRGRYSASVDAVVTPLDLNRVAISLDIDEGRIARINEINIIGNEAFSDSELLSEMSLSEESWHSAISQSGRYAKEELLADIESLRSFYLDRGFMNFQLLSSDVSISQNKQDIFISLALAEGERFSVGEIVVEGGGGFSAQDLIALVSMAKGEFFSRKDLVASRSAIEQLLGDHGYAFANVNTITDIGEDAQRVDFVFAVDPGPLIYVRKINISGNQTTRDEVIRREVRQLESSVFSAEKIRRSRERIRRLGFFDGVNIETASVPGTVDQVDLTISVKERATGNLMFGAGYADSDGLFLVASVHRANLFGTGRELGFEFEVSKIDQVFDIEYRNPYHTAEGVSRAFFLNREQTDTDSATTADYSSQTTGAGIRYKIPMSEYNALSFSAAFEQIDLEENLNTPLEYISFIDLRPNNTNFNLTTGFSKDTRDSIFFPKTGFYRRISGEAAIPGSDLEYYKVSLRGSWYRRLAGRLVFNLRGDVGYGDGYGGLEQLPFFKNYYAGGASSVRGFESRSLGPVSSNLDSDPLGGNIRTVASMEMFAAIPGLEDSNDKRLSVFFDSGQVFGEDQNLEFDQLRLSVGAGFHWFSPVGPISLSYGYPLNDKAGDDVKKIQFTLGTLR